MSELMNGRSDQRDYRWRLLTTVSAFTLIAIAFEATGAMASDPDRPTVWIELGGQLERVDGGQETFAPPFVLAEPKPAPETISPLSLQHPSRYSVGGEASISVMPRDSDWRFSASVRYGRSNAGKHVHQQSYPVAYPAYLFGQFIKTVEPLAAQFVDTKTQHSESHAVIDFETGKDVGLGLFGLKGSSTVNVGVRFAQFTSKSQIALREDQDWHFSPKYLTIPSYGLYHYKIPFGQPYHSFAGNLQASRSFRGIGPSLSWNGSAPVVGSPESSEITFDWGANFALLFGRQKTHLQHKTAQYYHGANYPVFGSGKNVVNYNHTTPIPDRSHSVAVPNVGGFAGLSVRYSNAKVSLGYRADFFFGAMDGGIYTRKTYDRSFYGPFASVSIGLGG